MVRDTRKRANAFRHRFPTNGNGLGIVVNNLTIEILAALVA